MNNYGKTVEPNLIEYSTKRSFLDSVFRGLYSESMFSKYESIIAGQFVLNPHEKIGYVLKHMYDFTYENPKFNEIYFKHRYVFTVLFGKSSSGLKELIQFNFRNTVEPPYKWSLAFVMHSGQQYKIALYNYKTASDYSYYLVGEENILDFMNKSNCDVDSQIYAYNLLNAFKSSANSFLSHMLYESLSDFTEWLFFTLHEFRNHLNYLTNN